MNKNGIFTPGKPNLKHAYIELYAGAGGFSLGMIKAGMKCIAAVERSVDATATFWTNLCYAGWSKMIIPEDEIETTGKKLSRFYETPNWLFDAPEDDWLLDDKPSPCMNLFCWDIEKMTPEFLMETCEIQKGELGVIVGGPPCQGFSYAGDRKEDDKRNNHPFIFINFCKVIQPKMFLIENVPGILTLGKKKGDDEGPFPKWLRNAAEEAGYHMQYDIHNAKNYGVPQNRRRVLFAGVRKDLYENGLRFEFPEPTHTYNYFDFYGDETTDKPSQISLFETKKEPPKGEPMVNVFEAIGDLTSYKLSSCRDQDAKKLPFGDMGRGSNKAEDNFMNDDHFYYYRDRFNGIYFNRNHRDDIDTSQDMKHYKRCPECRRFNLKIRKSCHACDYRFSGIVLDTKIE